MEMLVGIFHSAMAATGASKALHAAGITAGHLMLLTPETGSAGLHTVSSEHPAGACDVKAGHVLGAATGFAGGLLGSAAVMLVVPGVGPILAVGALVASVLVGVTVGATVGGLVQSTFTMALAPEDVFVYEEALRQQCSLLLVKPVDEHQHEMVRVLFARLGTERLNDLREHWWRRQRQQEAVAYHRTHEEFAAHEVSYRRGFEAALDVRGRGKSYTEAAHMLAQRDPAMYQDDVFRYGFERGQVYYHAMLTHDLLGHTHSATAAH
jgi:hypothetical protein